jgi:hypothetical protein
MATVEMNVRVRDPNRFKITEMLSPYTALQNVHGNKRNRRRGGVTQCAQQ